MVTCDVAILGDWDEVECCQTGTHMWYILHSSPKYNTYAESLLYIDDLYVHYLLTPTCQRLCQVLDLDPTPILIAEVLFSNIGGAATGG